LGRHLRREIAREEAIGMRCAPFSRPRIARNTVNTCRPGQALLADNAPRHIITPISPDANYRQSDEELLVELGLQRFLLSLLTGALVGEESFTTFQ